MGRTTDPNKIPDRISVKTDDDLKQELADYWQYIGMDKADWDALPHSYKLLMMARKGAREAKAAAEKIANGE